MFPGSRSACDRLTTPASFPAGRVFSGDSHTPERSWPYLPLLSRRAGCSQRLSDVLLDAGVCRPSRFRLGGPSCFLSKNSKRVRVVPTPAVDRAGPVVLDLQSQPEQLRVRLLLLTGQARLFWTPSPTQPIPRSPLLPESVRGVAIASCFCPCRPGCLIFSIAMPKGWDEGSCC